MKSVSNTMFQIVAAAMASALLAPATEAKSTPVAKGKTPNSSAKKLPAPERVTSVEGITEYRLNNGLRVLLFPDPSKATVTVNLTYMVGSRHENYGETGMAHLLEHLMFKGSKKHLNIPQELTSHGARTNATTWYDRTNYFETVQATDENLRWALELEADRMINSFIAKKDLDSEMTVVRNEFERGENDPTSILEERALSTAYLWHNYGKSTIGARADLENVPIDRLQAFYRNYYQPDNATLLVAGKFDEQKTLEWINSIYSPIPRPSRKLQQTYTLEPTQDGERSVTLRRVGDVQAVSLVYHVPPGSHPDAAAVDLLTDILTTKPAGRLHKALVEAKKASDVGGYFLLLKEPGFVSMQSEVRQDQSLEDARTTMLATVDALMTQPPTKEEVDRARTSLLKDIELSMSAVDRVGLQLSEFIAMGDWRLFFLHRDRLRKVTPEDVQRVAATYFKPSNRTVGLFIPTPKPDRAEIPFVADVTPMVKDYKGDAPVAMGEAFDASPANIESRVTRSVLPGGMKLALLPKKTRGATVVASMTFRFGSAPAMMNLSVPADFAAAMLMRGTAKHSRQEIKDEFDRLKARVSVGGGAGLSNVSVETTRENFPAAMKLIAEVLREPKFSSEEFEQLRQERLASIEQQRSEPQSIASVAFGRHLNPYPKGDVRYTLTPDETIAELKAASRDQAQSFYTGFYGGSNGELAIVGDFEPKEVTALASELFSNWKSPKPFERIAREYRDIAPLQSSFEAPDKANAFFIAGMNLALRDDDPDYPALMLGNYILGGGFLNSRLATRIRQKEGLSYSVGSQMAASALDKAGTFVSFAIYAPENATRLEAAFKEEIAKMLKDGFTADEVREAKTGLIQSRQVARAQDAGLARTLASFLFLNRTMQFDADLDKKIEALTPESMVAAMRRHIDPSKITIIKAGDFAKAAAAAEKAKVN